MNTISKHPTSPTGAASASPRSFQHVAPELRLFSGTDSLDALVRELKRNSCKRAVVVCGRSVAASPAMAALRDVLGSSLAGECASVRPNSPVSAVLHAAKQLEALRADSVIAVGGGSAAVTARAASILLAEKRPPQELCTRRLASGEFESPRLEAPKLSQFVIPTTPSNGFVKAGSAVHEDETGRRLALFDPKTRAKAIFLHPDFLRTAPAELVRTAGLNTLSTTVEALESSRCDPISEAMLLHALRLTAQYLHRPEPDDALAREGLAIAGVLCGRGTDQAGGGLASVLAHAIGHRAHAANGLVNAIVLPHTMRFNEPKTRGSAGRIAQALGMPSPAGAFQPQWETAHAVAAVESLLSRQELPRRLRDIGLAKEQLGEVAQAAMADWFIGRAPRKVEDAAELLGILEAAW